MPFQMTNITRPGTAFHVPSPLSWLPLIVLPTTVAIAGTGWPAWIFMWSLAFAIYAGLKWLSFAACTDCERASVGRSWGYLLLWPGMDAKRFLTSTRRAPAPPFTEWVAATANTAFGASLLLWIVPIAAQESPFVAGWIGWVGIAFVLHFGLLHLLSLCWRLAGVDAPPIMDAPIKATSLGEFWGRRWNLAFRDLAYNFVFQPLLRRCGVAGATLAVFLVSGLIHDVVISGSVGAGIGLPTIYFLIQGLGLFVERSPFGKRIGLGRGVIGWLYCGMVTIAPVGLLFHRPFIERVVIPMLAAFRVL